MKHVPGDGNEADVFTKNITGSLCSKNTSVSLSGKTHIWLGSEAPTY